MYIMEGKYSLFGDNSFRNGRECFCNVTIDETNPNKLLYEIMSEIKNRQKIIKLKEEYYNFCYKNVCQYLIELYKFLLINLDFINNFDKFFNTVTYIGMKSILKFLILLNLKLRNEMVFHMYNLNIFGFYYNNKIRDLLLKLRTNFIHPIIKNLKKIVKFYKIDKYIILFKRYNTIKLNSMRNKLCNMFIFKINSEDKFYYAKLLLRFDISNNSFIYNKDVFRLENSSYYNNYKYFKYLKCNSKSDIDESVNNLLAYNTFKFLKI